MWVGRRISKASRNGKQMSLWSPQGDAPGIHAVAGSYRGREFEWVFADDKTDDPGRGEKCHTNGQNGLGSGLHLAVWVSAIR